MAKFTINSWTKIALVVVLFCTIAISAFAQDSICRGCGSDQVLVELNDPYAGQYPHIVPYIAQFAAYKYKLIYSPSHRIGTPPTFLMTIDKATRNKDVNKAL